jgi:GDP-4-dehydro-6-deoxy-D-mannose reductase
MSNTDLILITGGTGFAGSHLVEALLQQGFSNIHVTAYSLHENYVTKLLPAEHIHQVNLTNADDTAQLIKQLNPQQIYHLAAIAEAGQSFSAAEQTIVNNTVLQLNLLEATRLHAPQARVLIVGSAQEYDFLKLPPGEPSIRVSEDHPLGPGNPYAVSKVTQDLLGLSYHYAYKLDVVRARPFNHIGERQMPTFAVPAFAQQIALAEKGQSAEITVGNLEGIRDFTDVKDMVAAYILLMEKGQTGEVYNIGSGHGVKMKAVLDELVSFSSFPITVTVDQDKLRPLDVPAVIADNARIKQLGWQPTIPLNDSLLRVLTYWRQVV